MNDRMNEEWTATLEDEPSHCLENWCIIHPMTRRHSPELRDLKAETVRFAELNVQIRILTCLPFMVIFPIPSEPLQ